jgi:hypothetical protein
VNWREIYCQSASNTFSILLKAALTLDAYFTVAERVPDFVNRIAEARFPFGDFAIDHYLKITSLHTLETRESIRTS